MWIFRALYHGDYLLFCVVLGIFSFIFFSPYYVIELRLIVFSYLVLIFIAFDGLRFVDELFSSFRKRLLLLNQKSKVIHAGNLNIKSWLMHPILSLLILKRKVKVPASVIFNPFNGNKFKKALLPKSNNFSNILNNYGNKVQSRQNHRWHYVDPSPWPVLISYAITFSAIGLLIVMHDKFNDPGYFYLGITMLLFTVFLWWRDLVREVILGHKTTVIFRNLRQGFLLFLVVETMFFVPFFWAFFYYGLSFCVHIGGQWPGAGLTSPLPDGVPLLNTGLLLTSGLSCQIGLNSVRNQKHADVVIGFLITLILGFIFLFNQVIEYLTLPFSIFDGVFGATFYLLTGLHGVHVLVGFIFIFVCWVRYLKKDRVTRVYAGFLFACWYWHFVDIIWLILFFGAYVWTGFFKFFPDDFAWQYQFLLTIVLEESVSLREDPEKEWARLVKTKCVSILGEALRDQVWPELEKIVNKYKHLFQPIDENEPEFYKLRRINSTEPILNSE